MTGTEWADKYFRLSPDSSYIEGDWKTVPNQIAILNAMTNDEIEEVNWLKSARVGYTKVITIATGYFIEHRRRNIMTMQPDDGARDDYSKQHIDPMIRDTKPVLSLFPWFGKKHKNNTIDTKAFQNQRNLFMRGGKAAKNYREKSVHVMIYDELSKFDLDIEGEGDPLFIGDKRLEGSPFRKSIRGSTPTIFGECQITTAAEDTRHFFRRYIPCPHCEEMQVLKFGGPDEDHGLKWDKTLPEEDQPKSVSYQCEHCGEHFKYSDFIQADHLGIYKTEEGVWTKDGINFFDSDDQPRATPVAISFHLWTAYSHFSPWSRIISDWLKVKKSPEKLKSFVNTTLGEPWQDKGESVDDDALYRRRETYAAEVPREACVVTAAVDVQDDRLELGVEAWAEHEQNWKIDFVILRGDPAQPEIWERLDERLSRTYHHESGIDLPIACTTIDSGGHYTQEVYNFCKPREIRNVFAIRGGNQDAAPVVSRPSKNNLARASLFTVGTSTAKEIVYARLRHTIEDAIGFGPGVIHFPVHELFDQEYFKQITAEHRVLSRVNGVLKKVWKKKRDRNEALDIAVYNLAALYILNPNYQALAAQLEPQPDTPEEQPLTVAQEMQKERRKAHSKRRKRGNFATSWR